MEIIPGRSVGPFSIGSTIGSTLTQVVSGQRLKYDTDFLFDDKAPYSFDIVLDLKSIGVQLRFDPITQRLWTIDVYDIGKINLAYGGEIFAGTSQATPTLRALYRLFGPTFPGKFDTDLDCYILSYRGLSFAFQVPHQAVKPQEIPMSLPDGTEPLATRLLIHAGPDLRVINLPRELCRSDSYVFISLYVSNIKSFGCTSFTVHMFPSNAFFQYNDTVQHVLSELGTPASTYDKVEDKMKIHRGQNNTEQNSHNKTETTSDYFYNYFGLGMDILFDGETHTVKKIIVHTNIPGQSSFNQYSRCHYQLRHVQSGHTSFVNRSRFSLDQLNHQFNLPFQNNNNNSDTDHSIPSRETSPIPAHSDNNNSLIRVISSSSTNGSEVNDISLSSNQETPSNQIFGKKKKKKKKKKASTALSGTIKSGSNNNASNFSTTVAEQAKNSGAGIKSNSVINQIENIDIEENGEGLASMFLIQPNTPWTEIEGCLGKAAGPMIRAPPDSGRYDSSGRMSAPSPFVATKMYAYAGAIYEVLQNDYVSNVTIFCT